MPDPLTPAELPDLVDIPTASRIAERSEATIRRWIREGRLPRHEAEAPSRGGSAQVIVSTRDLLMLLAVSGQQPRERDEDTGDHVDDRTGDRAGDRTGDGAAGSPILGDGQGGSRRDGDAHPAELAELRARLAVAEAEARRLAEVGALRVELAAARAELVAAEARATRAEGELERARAEGADWRGRHDAREAELAAMRASGGPWWRRLLGG